MADEELKIDDAVNASKEISKNDRMNAMQSQIDSMSHEIVQLNQALRSKSSMITRLSAELEKLSKRMDKYETNQSAHTQRERNDEELKEEMDKMPIPDLTPNNSKNQKRTKR